MDRRDFLQRVASALALALTPSVTGCATVGGPDLGGLADVDFSDLATRLRGTVNTLRDASGFPNMAAWARERGLDPELPGKIMSTMWVTSTFRDLPGRVRRAPEIQGWIKDEAPVTAWTTFEVAEALHGLPPEERAQLSDMLREPPVEDALLHGLAAHAERRGVEPERREQGNKLVEHTMWRLRHQSADAVIQDYLHRFDRLCKRHGAARDGWRGRLAAEIEAWTALDVLAAADAADVLEAAEHVAPDEAIDALTNQGGHLGVTLTHRRGQPHPRIESVIGNSPAAKAGLLPGDRIVAVSGRPFRAPELVAWLSARHEADAVDVIVRRDGDEVARTVVLGAGPGDRIVVPTAAAAFGGGQFAMMSAALGAAGLGVYTLGVGGGIFVLGLLLIAAGGGLGTGVGDLGAVLTVLGGCIMVLGLFAALIGAVTNAFRRRR